MADQRALGAGERAQPLVRHTGPQEERRSARPGHLATGTLACPACDAPVLPVGVLRPAEPIACPLCEHAGAVRDFLSLAAPARSARVAVRVVGAG